MKEFCVRAGEEGQRLDKYLKRYLQNAPQSFLYKMLRKKNITLNGKRAAGSEKLAAGDVVCLYLSDETILRFTARPVKAAAEKTSELFRIPDIIYRDEDFLFVNKPSGMLTQKASGQDVSLTEIIRYYLEKNSGQQSTAGHASPANRLDRNTSGIVLFGLTPRGTAFLTECLRERTCTKIYRAVVCGKPPREGIFRTFFRKDEKKNMVELCDSPAAADKNWSEMVTEIRDITPLGDYSAAHIILHTGRPHQIRAHLSHLGCPVAGDPKYGNAAYNRILREHFGISRQMLHSETIIFPDTEGFAGHLSGRTFYAEAPADMTELEKSLMNQIKM